MVPSSLLPSFADSYRPNKKVLLELAGISILAKPAKIRLRSSDLKFTLQYGMMKLQHP